MIMIDRMQWRILDFRKGGAGIERRRREDRGAVGAEGGGAWGGDVPLPTRGGVWGGGCAPSPENFWTFYLEIALYGAF